jgi:hypothetical protein
MRHHGIGIAIALDDIDGTLIGAGCVLVLQRTRLLSAYLQALRQT